MQNDRIILIVVFCGDRRKSGAVDRIVGVPRITVIKVAGANFSLASPVPAAWEDPKSLKNRKQSSLLWQLKQAHARFLRRKLVLGMEDPSLPFRLLYASLSPGPSSAINPSLHLFNRAIRAVSKSPLALRLYALMPALGIPPDNFTFPFALNTCAAAADLSSGSELHSRLLRTGFAGHLPVSNALIDMYGKCSVLTLARRAFDDAPFRDLVSRNALLGAHARVGREMPAARALFDAMSHKNLISYNALILGYLNAGDPAAARNLFDTMPARNAVSWTLMITGCCKNGMLDAARHLFDIMPQRNLVSWTSMIAGCAHGGCPKEAVSLFHAMRRSGVEPDAAAVACVASAVSQLGSPDLAGWVGAYADRKGVERNARVLTALVHMHAKCGDVGRALSLFEEIPSPDAFSYTALINGLASNGHSLEALKVFGKMREGVVKPDPVTFVGVLSACCHAGLVEDGLRFWRSMAEDYEIEPCAEHYACAVDMLGRAGRLAEAYKMIKGMPGGPPVGALGAMLAACRTYGNVEIAEAVAGELFVLEPENTGNYVLLSSIYAEKGFWGEAVRVRKMMRAGKLPGSSWI